MPTNPVCKNTASPNKLPRVRRSGLSLLVILLISWKHEIVGGVVFILAGLAYITMLLMNKMGADLNGIRYLGFL